MKQSAIIEAQEALQKTFAKMQEDVKSKEEAYYHLMVETASDMRCGDESARQATKRLNDYYHNTLEPLYGYVNTLQDVLGYFNN